MRHLLPLLVCGLLACNGGQADTRMPAAAGPSADEIPLKVHRRCPGDPACPGDGTGPLYVGVARRDITPAVETFTDSNHNGVWDRGEPFEDANGNGVFDAYWMAGFGLGRLALGVHDPQWARALAIRQDGTLVVLVAVDTLGLFHDESAAVQALLPRDVAGSISLLLLHATHTHQAADLTGGWGADITHSGINPGYQHYVRQAIADAISEAVGQAAAAMKQGQAAQVTLGAIAVEDGPRHDMSHYIADTRDPVVIDDVLHTIQFSTAAAPHAPIATLINWSNHPEAAGGDNQQLSSDFVHYLREHVEEHGGGTVVYVSGSIGGLLTPLHASPVDEDGLVVTDNGFRKAEALGLSVARFALQAMADPAARTVSGADARLSFRDTLFKVEVQNTKFQLAAALHTFQRAFCCYDTTAPFSDDNAPWMDTQAAYLRLGPAAILTAPGELFPESFLGGYHGEYAGTYRLLDPMQPNAPDLGKAPAPPYLIDVMDGERPHRMIFGLTADFVGYIVPRYSFVLDEASPYLKEPPGEHYEETNSLGPLAEPQVAGTLRQLVQSRQ